jgi:sugar phosphate isomerase/epimerase
MPDFSLSFLTSLDAPPPAAIRVAAAAGYQHAGLRLLPAAPGGICHPLMDDAPLLRETLAAMKDTGIDIFDIEIIRLSADFKPETYLGFLDAGARLGARSVLVAGDDDDENRLVENFGSLCDAASGFGLSADLEFMPQTKVRDVAAALRILRKAARDNGAIIVDALHFARSGSTLDEVSAIPPHWMNYVQICDAPGGIPTEIDALNHTARLERLLPGEGDIDLHGLFSRLPEGLPISVEIPNAKRAPALGALAWAKQALEASKRLLASVEAGKPRA